MYHLTPNGIEAIGKLTFNFLKKKIREYDNLKQEIKTLNDLLKETDNRYSSMIQKQCPDKWNKNLSKNYRTNQQ